MDPVSLTTFVDFVLKAGSPKLTVVRDWKHRGDYKPATDFYKRIREGIVDMHRDNRPVSSLTDMLAGLTDGRKQTAYPLLVDGYRRWARRKQLVWFEPPSGVWRHDDFVVNVNPELGLYIHGVPHLVKLYFKRDEAPKNRVATVTHMIDSVCRIAAPDGCHMAVLDVRRARLLTGRHDSATEFMLKGEAAYWLTVWPEV